MSVENLLEAWKEFLPGKRRKADVLEFQYALMENILALHADLAAGAYTHGPYHGFKIADPKPRDIHKATVRDRLLHHAVYRILYPYFDRTFIADSYSCREGKGTHRAMERFTRFTGSVSRNHTRTCWVLKCDVRKFFASIDHATLFGIVEKHIACPRTRALIREIVGSFPAGLPLGNLTSQLLVNVYMNEFDQYAKRGLKVRHYIRYADDFVFLSPDRAHVEALLPRIHAFLSDHLKLSLHPHKVSISTHAAGIDFLGWVHFPRHRVLRTSTKRRMQRTLAAEPTPERIASYTGLLSHGNAYRLCSSTLHRTRSIRGG